MTIQELAAKVTGLEPEIASLKSSQAALASENKTLKEQLSTLTPEAQNNARLLSDERAAHALTKDALTKANEKLAAAEARATAAEAKVSTFEAEIKTAREELANKPAEVNRITTQILSKLGISPIADTKSGAGGKKDFSHLNGIERAIAAQQASYQNQ